MSSHPISQHRPASRRRAVSASLAATAALLAAVPGWSSSHMDAPLITFDDAANTTDVYAFLSEASGRKYLTAALAVYPFEEPGIGPNKFNFGDDVRYEIHVAAGKDLAAGQPTWTYRFEFDTKYKDTKTILQSYLGVVEDVDDAAQNLTQRYCVSRLHHRSGKVLELGEGVVPPNNQGIATPYYNQDDNGEKPAREGVDQASDLDRYTRAGIASLRRGHLAFAGQRDDGFYGDIQAIFDLLSLRTPGKDAQQGFNVHTLALNIPLDEIGGDAQVVGVFATTSRRSFGILDPGHKSRWVQVGRQGNPLFCEGLVAIEDKDTYNRTGPHKDARLFRKYAEKPELARLINLLVFGGHGPAPETGRTDIAGIFIPDLIKVDLSTEPARLAGGAAGAPDDAGFSRLGIFGGDVLLSRVQKGFDGKGLIPGGWPNGRRFGDDVVDIAVTALISDLRVSPPVINGPAGDNVDGNDIGYNKVFPYAATPLNGRNHGHH